MSRYGILFFIIVILSSCFFGNENNTTEITGWEEKGIDSILYLYGGKCKYFKKMSFSTNMVQDTFFQIELSGSSVINSELQASDLHSSNIGYILYENIVQDNNNPYSRIKVILKFEDGSKHSKSYTFPQLNLVHEKIKFVEEVIYLIKEEELAELKELFSNDENYLFDKDEIIKEISSAELKLDSIKEFIPCGFDFSTLKDDRESIHISGIVKRKNGGNTQFSLDVYAELNINEIIQLQYKF
jgi:hypothetical protein